MSYPGAVIEVKHPDLPRWTGPFNRLIAWHIRRVEAEQERGFTRRLLIRMMGVAVVGLAAVNLHNDFGFDPAEAHGWKIGGALVLQIVLCWFVVRAAMISMKRVQAYNNGWYKGRNAMINAYYEAAQRGMSPGEWIKSQVEQDIFRAFGQPVQVDWDEIARAVERDRREREENSDG